MIVSFIRSMLVAMTALAASVVAAQEAVLNLYTSRHYQTDESLYTEFTAKTGIKVNRVEGKEDELIERLKREGANSPADVFLTSDVARLQDAKEAGLFARADSNALGGRVPAAYRDADGTWYGMSYRARVIAYNKNKVKPDEVATYAALADPKFKGRVCVRSGGHPYNRTLVAAMNANQGEEKTEQWVKGLVANLAQDPRGGDTDQVKSVAAGECDVALTNHYYYVRLLASTKPEDQDVVSKAKVAFPDQAGAGTHINISGGGMLKNAPHKEAAVKFLEYLASDSAQTYFANGNNEWPVVAGVKIANPPLEAMGSFKTDKLSADALAKNSAAAQRLIDRAGWK
jgi:iron(III) transport system substrate-binding protein